MIFSRKYGVGTTIDGIPLVTRGAVDFKANPTLATGDVKISKDGGAFANVTTLATVTPSSSRSVQITLSNTEMEAARIVIEFVDQTDPKEWEDQRVVIETHSHASAQHIMDEDSFDTGFYDEINLVVALVLTLYRLDHLMAASVTGTDVVDNSVIARLVSKSATADWDSYNNTTDSLEAIRDRGDAEWIDAGGASPFLLLDTTVAVVNSQTDFDLTSGPALTGAMEGCVAIIYDASNADAPSVRRVASYTLTDNNVVIDSIGGVGGAPDFTVVAGDKVRIFAVPVISAEEHDQLILSALGETLETPIGGSPNAGSINERIKALDDNYTAARGLLLDNLDAAVSTRSTVTTAQVNAEVDAALNTAIPGSPTAGSVNERVAAIDDKLPSGAIVGNDTATSTRMGYLDKLNITGNVAGSAEVTAIQNNTRVRVVVPAVIERPDSGSTDYRLHLYLYDSVGNMEAPDTAPTVTAVNEAGTDRSSNLSGVTLVSTGHYYVIYTVSSAHAIEQLLIEWTVTEGGAVRLHGAVGQVVETTAVNFTSTDRTNLEAVKAKTDILTFTGSDVRATLDGELTVPTAAAVADAVWDESRSGHVSAGTFGAGVLVESLNANAENEVAAALAVMLEFYGLDHLVGVAGTSSDIASGSFIARMAGITSWATFDRTTDSLEAIRNRGDAAWTGGGGGGGGATAEEIADAVAQELLDDHASVDGSLFWAIKHIVAEHVNLAVANKVTGRVTVYDDDGTTPLHARELVKGGTEAEVRYEPV